MGIVELSVLGFVVITVFMGMFTVQQLGKRRGSLGIEREPDEAADSAGKASTLVQIMRAKARGMTPGRVPLDALPVRDEAPDWLAEATRWLELSATVEEDATARQSDDARVCRIVLREPRSGAAWELELVGDGEWVASPGGEEAAATFTTRCKIEDMQARRRFVGAFGEAMGLGAPPTLDGDEDAEPIKIGHYGIIELEGRRWEALRFELTVGTIYPLWLLMDRAAGQARLLVNTDPEERPMVVIGVELATRGVGARYGIYEVPAIAERPVWVTTLEEVGGSALVEDAELEGRCVSGPGETLCAVIEDGDGIKVLRWRSLGEPPEVLYTDTEEAADILEVSWSGGGERVFYRVEDEPGYRGYDLGMRTAYKGLLAELDGDSNHWELSVAERWPLVAVARLVDDEEDEDESAYEIRVVELDGSTRWSMSTTSEASYAEVAWTTGGLYIEISYDDERMERLLWEPGDREARVLSARVEAGPREGRAYLVEREGYGAQLYGARGERLGVWTPSCMGELDALYFWSPNEHIWSGDKVIMDDYCWSVVDARTGEVRPLCASGEEDALTVLAGGDGWIVAEHEERGLVWARLGEAQGVAW